MEAVRKAEQRGTTFRWILQLVRDDMMSSVPLLNRLMMQLGVVQANCKIAITQAGMTTKTWQDPFVLRR